MDTGASDSEVSLDQPYGASADSRDHSFIVRIWIEETVEEVGRLVWRGSITHVPGGERRSIEDLNAIVDFIAPFLEALGARPSLSRQLRTWWQGIKRWVRLRSTA